MGVNMKTNLELYKIFYYVAKNGNITQASKELLVSQPAVSKAIKVLERDLNTVLFNRNSDGVSLNNAGEILFTSMDHDGVKHGFANDALALMSTSLPIPIIASGGAGCMADFKETFTKGKSDAALAASVFHDNEISIKELKQYLRTEGINVRI